MIKGWRESNAVAPSLIVFPVIIGLRVVCVLGRCMRGGGGGEEMEQYVVVADSFVFFFRHYFLFRGVREQTPGQ